VNAVTHDVIELINKEFDFSMTKYPWFNSPHEGYAVIKEEVEEASEELDQIINRLAEVWNNIRCNMNAEASMEFLLHTAINAITELIQVAAMAQKYKVSFNEEMRDVYDRTRDTSTGNT
jgi:hypothetical protein